MHAEVPGDSSAPLTWRADVRGRYLFEVVEATPDTVVTLADGRKIVVSETPARLFRATVLATSEELRENRRSGAPVLSVLPTDRGDRG